MQHTKAVSNMQSNTDVIQEHPCTYDARAYDAKNMASWEKLQNSFLKNNS